MSVYASEVNGNMLITGGLYGLTAIDIPASTIVNASVSASAAISASKCERSLRYQDWQSGEAADDTIPAFFVKGTTLTFKHFTVSCQSACAGSSTVTVDIKKNGTSILSAAEELSHADAAYSENEATISTTTASDGDYITIVINATQNGTDALAQDVFWQLDYDETYAN